MRTYWGTPERNGEGKERRKEVIEQRGATFYYRGRDRFALTAPSYLIFRTETFHEMVTRTGVKLFMMSKVQRVFCFENCTTQWRGEEKGGSENFETNHPEPLTSQIISHPVFEFSVFNLNHSIIRTKQVQYYFDTLRVASRGRISSLRITCK